MPELKCHSGLFSVETPRDEREIVRTGRKCKEKKVVFVIIFTTYFPSIRTTAFAAA